MLDNTFPIILAHGIARFDAITQKVFKLANVEPYDGLHYFRNIRGYLQNHGFRVFHTNVEWAESVDVRSRSLKQQIERILAEDKSKPQRVHVIAHSMGGLDARHMLYDSRDKGFHERVASLTTIGTPHHGSPVADSVVEKAGKILKALKIGDGARDLTTEACKVFNEQVESWESQCSVKFRAYAGHQEYPYILDPLKPMWKIINKQEGDNDGLVSVESAKWKDGYFVEPVLDADHFNLCGWWDPAELRRGIKPSQMEQAIKDVYLRIARILAAEFPSDK